VQVSAIATPRQPGWHWRITGYNGETLEESHEKFATISAAVAAGTQRLVELSAVRP
jgi:hypothetical protein